MLLVTNEVRILPLLEVMTTLVRAVEHEASTSKISEEQCSSATARISQKMQLS